MRHPELLRGVVIAHSSARYPDEVRAMWAQRIAAIEQGGLAAIADATMERWFTPAFRAAQPELVERTRQTLLRTDPAGYIACGRAVAAVDWLDRLAEIKTPALVIAGTQDAGAPPAMSRPSPRASPAPSCACWRPRTSAWPSSRRPSPRRCAGSSQALRRLNAWAERGGLTLARRRAPQVQAGGVDSVPWPCGSVTLSAPSSCG